MQSLFCEGYGMEEKAISDYLKLNDRIFGYIVPFIHENTSSLIADLVASKNAGILSVQSATEHHPWAANDETERINVEVKQEQQADRLYQLKNSQNQ